MTILVTVLPRIHRDVQDVEACLVLSARAALSQIRLTIAVVRVGMADPDLRRARTVVIATTGNAITVARCPVVLLAGGTSSCPGAFWELPGSSGLFGLSSLALATPAKASAPNTSASTARRAVSAAAHGAFRVVLVVVVMSLAPSRSCRVLHLQDAPGDNRPVIRTRSCGGSARLGTALAGQRDPGGTLVHGRRVRTGVPCASEGRDLGVGGPPGCVLVQVHLVVCVPQRLR